MYSGPVHLNIPSTFTGLFVNVVNGSAYTGPGSFPTCPGSGCNYDFNIYGSGTRSFFAPGSAGISPAPVAAEERGYVSATPTGNPIVLAPGTLIDYAFDATPGAAIAAGDVGSVAVIPEPSAYLLLGAGLAGVGAIAWRRRTG